MNTLEFYTDGCVPNNVNSTKNNVDGGIGVYCEQLNLEISERIPNATNNIVELTAIKRCLEYILEHSLQSKNNIIIHSDSQYSVNCCTIWYKNWITPAIISKKRTQI